MINFDAVKKIADLKVKLKSKIGKMKESNEEFIARVLDDLEKNHNHSWYQELYVRNIDNLDDVALKYRGSEVTYKEMFSKMREYAMSLKNMGIEKGMEIPVCMSNTPELVYLLGAASIVGAKVNIFANSFDPDYIKEIIADCDTKVMFVEDGKYPKIADAIRDCHVPHVVVTSLTDSLPNGINPYQEVDAVHGSFKNTVSEVCADNSKCMSISDFVKAGRGYEGDLFADCDLDDEFLITYTSGSTHSSRPKAIVHAVRSLITIGRCHDPDVQKTTSMKDFTIQAQVPTHSNTDIISSISDALMQGSKLALEPIYDKNFFIDTLLINQPTYVVATRSFWVQAAKDILYSGRNIQLPNLLLAFAAGEPLEKNEEKLMNKALRKAKAGKNVIPLPVSPVTMSVAGGDCEHGGIFWLLFRSLQSKTPGYAFKKEPHGMNPFQMVEVAVLDSDGNHLPANQIGRLVANSPCNMKMYKNNREATQKFFIQDANGKTWGDCNVYGYLDENGAIYMKGRIPDKEDEIPTFVVADSILRDTKNVLSCEVVTTECEDCDEPVYVAHIELQPDVDKSVDATMKALVSSDLRCVSELGEDVSDRVFFRLHHFADSYPLTGSGKRDFHSLKEEGLSEKCFKPVYRNGEVLFLSPEQYFSRDSAKVKQK